MKRTLRVAAGTIYPFRNVIRGGVQAQAAYLLPALARQDGLDLHVVSCSVEVPRAITEQREGATFHWLPTISRLYGLRALTLDAYRVARLYARLEPDVIHALGGISEYAVGARSRGVPKVLTIHATPEYVEAAPEHHAGLIGIYRRLVDRAISTAGLRGTRAIIWISPYVQDSWAKRIGPSTVCYRIPYAVADAYFQLADKSSDSLLLLPAAVIPAKRVLEMIAAMPHIVAQCPSARLLVAGGMPDRAYIQRIRERVSTLRLDGRVMMPGQVSQLELLDAYSRASVVVMPSRLETFCLSVAQGMAAGKPVVATHVGGIPYVVGEDGRAAFLVPLGDDSALAERIVMLLKDKRMRRNMGREGRRVARERFMPERVAAEVAGVYADVAG